MRDIADALGAPMAEGDVALVPLSAEHRDALAAACAEDGEIWPIYANDWGPAHFDTNFTALLAAPDRIGFAILDDDGLAGMSAYIGLVAARQTVEIGNTYLAPARRSTGLNGRIKRLMLDRAFACGIRRVEFRIDDRNLRSKAAVAKAGARFEGLLRAERITWTGHVRDTALFSILKEDGR